MNKKRNPLFLLLLIVFIFPQSPSKAQLIKADSSLGLSMTSLDEVMNVKIVSASREEEGVADAPLSSCVITRQEIALMGATSIPDALKVCPGVIVREIANGSYDVSIRGGVDGLPAYNYSYTNTSILVMIDNRPVFSSLQGGTYWQNLPIGLAEIERIEVISGPTAPLYGPNAVSGVINIISTHPVEEGFFVRAIAQGGPNTNQASIAGGTKVGDRFSADLGLNYDYRTRFEKSYYDPGTEKYISSLDSVSSPTIRSDYSARFPDEKLSLTKFGGALNLAYKINDRVNFSLSGSANNNMALNALAIGIVVSNFTNTSQSLYFKGKIYGFNLQYSILGGRQGLSGYKNENNYNYKNTDIYLDYNFKFLNDKISLRPALSYQSAFINDLPYTLEAGKSGNFNSKGSINNLAGSLKLDAQPVRNFRIILAGRYDQFNYPEKGFFSYQGILNYKVRSRHLLRFVTGRSYNGSFMIPTLINTSNSLGPGMQLVLQGNKNLKLMNNTMYEVGYRFHKHSHLIVDLALFTQHFQDFDALILKVPTVEATTGDLVFNYQYNNLPLTADQTGATFSIQSSIWKGKITIRPHITLQQTTWQHYSPYYNEKGAYNTPSYSLQGSIDSTYTMRSKSTPSIWGGFNIVVSPVRKLSFDVSGYAYDQYQLHINSETNFSNGQVSTQAGSRIKSKFLLNTVVSYRLAEKVSAFINVRNLLNQKAPEGFGSDKLGALFLIGLRINY